MYSHLTYILTFPARIEVTQVSPRPTTKQYHVDSRRFAQSSLVNNVGRLSAPGKDALAKSPSQIFFISRNN
jgi:hypothetical protein